MSLSDLASLGSFISGFAVLVSLIFLYFQLRQLGQQVAQAEKNQQASIRQGRADRTVTIAMGAADPGLADALVKAFTGAPDITATQLSQFSRYCFAVFNNYDDNFSQNRDGLLTDSAFATVVNMMGQILRQPSVRVQWKRQRASFGSEFAEFVDRLIARTPLAPTPLDTTVWLSDFAAERSGEPS